MTTIYYPDVSHYDRDRGVTIEPNTVAVIAKCTHGTAFVDSAFASFRQQAASRGSIFAGYHWLNHGGVQAQAAYYFKAAGRTPCMIDAEDTDKNTGYNGPLTLDDIVGFALALRALGGICNLVYLPRWYWDQHMGGPSLQPLQDAGLHLVSSDYVTYSDAGPGWNVYVRGNGAVEPSGMRPVAWQYTDALPYGGGTSDFNAFKGTPDQFRALLYAAGTGDDMDAVQDYRLKLLFENWDPTRDQWIAAGGDPKVWDAANAAGTARNGMKEWQAEVSTSVDGLTKQVNALTTKVASLAPAAATQEQVNTAVLAAMKDPTVQAGIGAAIAQHLHVS